MLELYYGVPHGTLSPSLAAIHLVRCDMPLSLRVRGKTAMTPAAERGLVVLRLRHEVVAFLIHAVEAARRVSGAPLSPLLHRRGQSHAIPGDFGVARVDYEAARTTAEASGRIEDEWQAFLDLGFRRRTGAGAWGQARAHDQGAGPWLASVGA